MSDWNKWYTESEHNRRKVPVPSPGPDEFVQEEDPYWWKRGMHYFIDDMAKNPEKLDGSFFHVLAGLHYTWADIESFGDCPDGIGFFKSERTSFYGMSFIHCTGNEPISKILALMKVFPSGAAAKQAGWFKPIPQGYSEMRIAHRLFYFWNPGPRELYTNEQLQGEFYEPFRLSRTIYNTPPFPHSESVLVPFLM